MFTLSGRGARHGGGFSAAVTTYRRAEGSLPNAKSLRARPLALPSERTNAVKRLHVSILALVASLAVPAVAQDIVLDEIIISGGIFPVEAKAYGRAYTVITAEEIARRGVTSLQEVLRAAPGVSVVSSGDTQTKVRLRGGESNHTLILIDGVELNESGNGDYTLTGLSLEDVDRIEILRGPQSTIYGSNAMAGVVSIITKKGSKIGTEYGGSLELGGQGTRAASYFIRNRNERGGISLTFAARHKDGEDGSRSGGDTEYNDQETLGLNGDYRLSDTVNAGFTLRRTWQDYGYDDTIPFGTMIADPADYVIDAPFTARRNQIAGSVWLEAESIDGRLRHRIALSGMNEGSDYFNSGAPNGDNSATQSAVKYSGSFALGDLSVDETAQKLNFALEQESETYAASFTGGDAFKRKSQSIALEYQGRFDSGIDLQAGVRHDFNQVFRDATSWNIAAAWQIPGQDIRLRGSVGKAIVNPTMFEQFGFFAGSYVGNPDLKPEESLGYDIGADIELANGRGSMSVTLFNNGVKSLITGFGNTSVNLEGKSKRRGVELGYSMQATDWLSVAADYTYTDARSAAGARLVRRPMHELGLRATAEFNDGRGAVTAELRHVAGSYDTQFWGSFPTLKLKDFTVVNVSARYDLTDNVQVTSRVTNIFDQDYSETWGYYGQGRTAYVGFSTKW
ncbi:MAG: TonB-dependent receptor [Pseudotabrizicola sp.]|uniref:TonB-dependent receptor plug domain-containing protein n=1 Tax=Pseudotabrizicola sp. TaxID=2939647 RepID=UPI002730A592|nr:TonB-dependent receptor [Pseudotabrizicola sp.]MDP2082555.1 TonB-dependent receptor [Pseudotabrizicola sp.]MDZ7573934.1 TonB-dependent receptor [Pseudotabrizicola sp.]